MVVAITGAPGGETLIRRAARMAGAAQGDLLGVHVRPADGLAADAVDGARDQRALLEELGGTYHEVVGDDVAAALVHFARAERATQLVLGASRRSRAGPSSCAARRSAGVLRPRARSTST